MSISVSSVSVSVINESSIWAYKFFKGEVFSKLQCIVTELVSTESVTSVCVFLGMEHSLTHGKAHKAYHQNDNQN